MSTTQEQRSTTMQEPRPQGSLVRRGRAGDTSAIATMLAPFLAEDEHVLVAQYLGIQGMWGLGVSSFAAVTDQRVTTIRVHPFGAVEYQDGALEHINSGVVIWIREGVSIYMFCDRHRFRQAAFVYRTASQARAMRMLALGRANGLDESPG